MFLTSIETRVRDILLPKEMFGMAPTIVRWTVLALAVRMLLAPILGSRDLSVTVWVSLVLLGKHQLIQSNDPPMIFLLFAGLFVVFNPLISPQIRDFYLSSRNFNPSEVMHVLGLAQPGIQPVLLILKLPYFFFDLGTGLIILRVIGDPKKGFLAYRLWLLSPVSIFVSYAIGQYDVIVTFFMTFALYHLANRRFRSTALLLGVASAVKAIGLLLLVPVAIYAARDGSGTLKITTFFKTMGLGLVPIVLGLLPVYFIPSFYESANLALPPIFQNGLYGTILFNRGTQGLSLLAGLESFVFTNSVTFRTGVPWDSFFLLPLMYMVLILALLHFRRWSLATLRDSFLIFLLGFYALSTFHAQWFLWVQPFLIMAQVGMSKKVSRAYWAGCLLFFFYLLNFGPFLTIGLLVPVYPAAMELTGPAQGPLTVSLRMLFSVVLLYTALLISLERWGQFLPWRRTT